MEGKEKVPKAPHNSKKEIMWNGATTCISWV